MRVIGLTGGIGCGKSLVAQFFAELGALVIDADQLARAAIERGSTGFDEVIATFGDSILLNGEINRKVLGELVFRDSNFMTADSSHGWDGYYRGKNLNSDIFTYRITAEMKNGEVNDFSGAFTLLR